MKRVNWEIFFGNSSTEEALCLFATRNSTFDEFVANCYYFGECQNAIKILKNRGYKRAIPGAQKALRVRGFSEYMDEYKDWRNW